MNRILLASLLSACAFTASAQTPATDPAAPVAKADAIAQADDDRDIDRNCLRSTGSRITATANARADARGEPAPRATRDSRRCAPAHGRVYSREDLERTGETDIADALRRLDTSIR